MTDLSRGQFILWTIDKLHLLTCFSNLESSLCVWLGLSPLVFKDRTSFGIGYGIHPPAQSIHQSFQRINYHHQFRHCYCGPKSSTPTTGLCLSEGISYEAVPGRATRDTSKTSLAPLLLFDPPHSSRGRRDWAGATAAEPCCSDLCCSSPGTPRSLNLRKFSWGCIAHLASRRSFGWCPRWSAPAHQAYPEAPPAAQESKYPATERAASFL